ncbi:hypothetical protein [Ruminococcus sp. 210702-SL.1.03]|uniref:hypothetical protein n=1 Tax=Ruminococcus sp. 210702-SL.1.03 TaxID=2883233 RepID=UPI001D06BF5C|nr:hypothetical protein [Ruminococcus sp. 210702-SL.1.03]MCB6616371.1 hypothetical protein [Ruminococcus sp. 210702-SL.1.03]
MKKLTAAVCAAVIALSMAGCGSSGLSSKKHSKNNAGSASAGAGDNSASDSKKSVMDVIAGGAAADDADIEINTDYEYKTLLGDGVNTDKAQLDRYVNSCMNLAKAIAADDFEAYKKASNFELLKELEPEDTESDMQENLDDDRDTFESASVRSELLEQNKIMKVYLQEEKEDAPDGYSYCTTAFVMMVMECENNMGYLSFGFILLNVDGKLLPFLNGTDTVTLEEMEEADSEFDAENGSGDSEYDKKSQLKTANSNSKTAYVALAENLADAETCGYPMDSVFSGSCDESWQVTPDKVYDASDPESISEGGAKKIAQALCDNADAGYFIVLRVQLNGSDGFAVQWTSDPSGGVFGHYHCGRVLRWWSTTVPPIHLAIL